MNVILQIAKREQWERGKSAGVYRGGTLSSQGLIHCSTPQQVIKVANALFGAQKELVLLCIESDKVRAEIRYEDCEGGERYPHIYGPLNIDAVIKVLDFEPGEEGIFELPRGIADVA